MATNTISVSNLVSILVLCYFILTRRQQELNDNDHTDTVCPITLKMVHTDLGVAPLCDALPAKQVSTGGGGGVSPLLQAEDAEGSSGAGALSVLWTTQTYFN